MMGRLFVMTNMEILYKQMVHKKALEGLKNEEEDMNELRDTMLQIKDLEKELEFMHSREPDEYKYIAFLEKRIDELYKKAEKLDEIN